MWTSNFHRCWTDWRGFTQHRCRCGNWGSCSIWRHRRRYDPHWPPVSERILWINGPKPAYIDYCVFLWGGSKSQPMSTWNKSTLYFHVSSWVKLVGDSSYNKQPDKVTPTLDAHASKIKKVICPNEMSKTLVLEAVVTSRCCSKWKLQKGWWILLFIGASALCSCVVEDR